MRRAEAQWQSIFDIRQSTRMWTLYFLGTLLATIVGVAALRPAGAADPLTLAWRYVEMVGESAGRLLPAIEPWSGLAGLLLVTVGLWWVVQAVVSLAACARAGGHGRLAERLGGCQRRLWWPGLVLILALALLVLLPAAIHTRPAPPIEACCP